MKTRLVWITPEAESVIGYCARVSNPANQDNPDVVGLLRYCIRNQHWSIFEMACMCVEIQTSRAISAQILRHKSFSFQEFSQRYAPVQQMEPFELRRQDVKNRQNSTDDLDELVIQRYRNQIEQHIQNGINIYNSMLQDEIAKECARMILPMSSSTTLYMQGTIRSWIHYLLLRRGNGTQKEHKLIANSITEDIFKIQLPTIYEAAFENIE